MQKTERQQSDATVPVFQLRPLDQGLTAAAGRKVPKMVAYPWGVEIEGFEGESSL